MGEVPAAPETTVQLVERYRQGDLSARDRLFERYYAPLNRFARGRLRGYVRGEADTQDLVQGAMTRALERLDAFDPKHPGAFLAYLRQIVVNLVLDHQRKVGRRPRMEELDEAPQVAAPQRDPAKELDDARKRERYEAALTTLSESDRAAVFLRIELQLTHQQVADELELASADAARMKVTRAVMKLTERMDE